jgi:hypothetical protein
VTAARLDVNRTTIVFVVILLLALAGAALVGGRLLFRQSKSASAGYGVINLERLPGLPSEEPAIEGAFVRRSDNSIFVGILTSNSRLAIRFGPGGATDATVDYDGPVIEAVVTHETEIYEERVRFQDDGSVEQTLAPGSLDDIEDRGTIIEVWGERRGDRVTADVLVFRTFSTEGAPAQP